MNLFIQGSFISAQALFSLRALFGATRIHSYRLHKPVTDWLETLYPQNMRTEYVREIPIGHN